MVTEIRQLSEQKSSDIIVKNPRLMERLPVMLPGLMAHLAVPERFMLGGLRDGRLRIVEPIEVRQLVEDNQFVLEAEELNEFGFGENLSEAIADLQCAIAELYFTLDAEQHRLGPDLAAVWDTLSRKVNKV